MEIQRSYSMQVRAQTKQQTRQRILRAALELAVERMTVDLTLGEIAARAGTTVQTVLRHFGSRDTLLDAAVELRSTEVSAERAAPVGDIEAATAVLMVHYEQVGDFVVRLLGQENDERVRRLMEPGKKLHRTWVETVYQPQIDARPDSEHDALTDLLVVATDVYTWKLLRRDRGLDQATTGARMTALVGALLRA